MNDQIDSDRQLGTHLGFGGLGFPAFRAGHGSKQKKNIEGPPSVSKLNSPWDGKSTF